MLIMKLESRPEEIWEEVCVYGTEKEAKKASSQMGI